MALVLDEHEIMLVDAARGLLERVAPISAFRARRDAGLTPDHDRDLLTELAANGLIAPTFSEAEDGATLSAVAAGLIAEQSGHMLAAAPLVSAAMAATLLAFAEPAQRSAFLSPLVAGQKILAVAFDERPRHDPDSLDTRAMPSGAGWALVGRKVIVIDGYGADDFLVSASLNGIPSVFIVAGDATGLAVGRTNTFDHRSHAHLTLTNVPAVLVSEGNASPAIEKALDIGRALLASELLGIADEAFQRTLAYIKERKQFDQTIGSFQALQHRAARLYARLELARGVVLKALRAIDVADEQASALASLAKLTMTKLARETLVEAMQMHGGIGVTDEFDLGFFVKRARVAGDLLGDDHFHIDRLSEKHWRL